MFIIHTTCISHSTRGHSSPYKMAPMSPCGPVAFVHTASPVRPLVLIYNSKVEYLSLIQRMKRLAMQWTTLTSQKRLKMSLPINTEKQWGLLCHLNEVMYTAGIMTGLGNRLWLIRFKYLCKSLVPTYIAFTCDVNETEYLNVDQRQDLHSLVLFFPIPFLNF